MFYLAAISQRLPLFLLFPAFVDYSTFFGACARIDGYLMSLGFSKSVVDAKLYYKIVDGESLILILCVDDLFLTGAESLIAWCKHELTFEFEMKDIGMMHYFLGLEVWQRTDEIFLSQGNYTVEILGRFGILDYKSMATSMVSN
jgi:hypothetical protein